MSACQCFRNSNEYGFCFSASSRAFSPTQPGYSMRGNTNFASRYGTTRSPHESLMPCAPVVEYT